MKRIVFTYSADVGAGVRLLAALSTTVQSGNISTGDSLRWSQHPHRQRAAGAGRSPILDGTAGVDAQYMAEIT